MTSRGWIILIVLAVALLIILDEISFNIWKFSNPGAQWSGAADAPLVDPTNPPRSWG
jgi:hypothetical protein